MPDDSLTFADVQDAAIDAAHVAAGGFLPEPWRSVVLAAIDTSVRLLRPDLIVVETGPETVVTVEAE